MRHTFDVVDVDLSTGGAVFELDRQRKTKQEFSVVSGVELGDIIDGDVTKDISVCKAKTDIERVAANGNDTVTVDAKLQWHIDVFVFEFLQLVYAGYIRE